jgi:hypothetical protein
MSTARALSLAALSLSLAGCSSPTKPGDEGTAGGAGVDGSATGSGAGADASGARGDAGGVGTGAAGSAGAEQPNANGGSGAKRPGTAGAGPSSASAGAAGEVACVELESQTTLIQQEATLPILEFQIDVTGSMDDDASPDDSQNDASKWREMQRVLPTAFASLPEDWAVGVSYFSKPDDCYEPRQAVPIAPLNDDQLTTINDSIADRHTGGYTPTLAAWRFAIEQVTSWDAPTSPVDYTDSPRYVVLITDGIPTVTRDGCTVQNPIDQDEYDYLVDSVKTEGEQAGVRTFVVGVLGSEDPQGATYDPLYMLSQVATAGGTGQPEDCVAVSGTVSEPVQDGRGRGATNRLETRGTYCHFDMTTDPDFAAGLLSALQSIAEQVETVVPMSCSYEVPEPPQGYFLDPDDITVTHTSGAGKIASLTRSPDESCANGDWFVEAEDSFGIPTTIELCPDTCSVAQQDPGAAVSLSFGCVVPM